MFEKNRCDTRRRAHGPSASTRVGRHSTKRTGHARAWIAGATTNPAYLILLVLFFIVVVIVSRHLGPVPRKMDEEDVVFLRFRAQLGECFADVGTRRDKLIRARPVVFEHEDVRLVKTLVALQHLAHDVDIYVENEKDIK